MRDGKRVRRVAMGSALLVLWGVSIAVCGLRAAPPPGGGAPRMGQPPPRVHMSPRPNPPPRIRHPRPQPPPRRPPAAVPTPRPRPPAPGLRPPRPPHRPRPPHGIHAGPPARPGFGGRPPRPPHRPPRPPVRRGARHSWIWIDTPWRYTVNGRLCSGDGLYFDGYNYCYNDGFHLAPPPAVAVPAAAPQPDEAPPASDEAPPPPPSAARRVMNIVNFVRSLDPRGSHADYVEALKAEVELNTRYGFKNTILLQYDALVDPEMLAVARTADPAKTEYGLWFEMSKPLNDAAGVPWRPKQGADWQWDWFINPGFLMAYTPAQRKSLIDAAFARFRREFGHHPRSVGAWLIDAWSMDYMVTTYGVDGFCICREQDNTDAYGLRGGYSNGLYYPARRNMLSAAVDMRNAIRAPVFKMLTPDPIYNYANPKDLYADYPYAAGCPTMEPVWPTGNTPQIIDWFFRVYTESPGLLNLSYMQTGQENTFGVRRIMMGLPHQCERIAALRDAGALEVETMGETARRFKADHPANVPQTQVALEDWSSGGRKSVWYNSRHYRANLFLDKDRLVFRDIHKMCDDFQEPHYDTPCAGWQAEYFTPPFVDQHLQRAPTNGVSGVMALDGVFRELRVTTPERNGLVVEAVRADGTCALVTFREDSISVSGTALDWQFVGAKDFTVSFSQTALDCTFRGYAYRIGLNGACSATPKGLRISQDSSAPIRFRFN
ncbi:MAG: hypothetical protein ACI4RA_04080 [Kiritimatiellia bacterium]